MTAAKLDSHLSCWDRKVRRPALPTVRRVRLRRRGRELEVHGLSTKHIDVRFDRPKAIAGVIWPFFFAHQSNNNLLEGSRI